MPRRPRPGRTGRSAPVVAPSGAVPKGPKASPNPWSAAFGPFGAPPRAARPFTTIEKRMSRIVAERKAVGAHRVLGGVGRISPVGQAGEGGRALRQTQPPDVRT